MGLGVEQTRQLYLSVCVLADVDNRLNLTLTWQVHQRVKSEVNPGEVSWGTHQLDHWTQCLATGKITNMWSDLRVHVSGLGLLSAEDSLPDAHRRHDSQLI